MIRNIIKIDEEQCNGCGLCAEACHEGAIGMVNGKAKLLRDDIAMVWATACLSVPRGPSDLRNGKRPNTMMPLCSRISKAARFTLWRRCPAVAPAPRPKPSGGTTNAKLPRCVLREIRAGFHSGPSRSSWRR